MEGSTSAIRATPVPQGGDWDNSTITSGFRPMGKERVRGDEIEIQGGGYKGKEESETLTGAEDDQECERKEIESKRYYVKMCSNRDAQRYKHRHNNIYGMFSLATACNINGFYHYP